MGMKTPSRRSHLFTVRVWQEELEEGLVEWRGRVQLMTSGDVRYFRDWSALVPLLLTMLSESHALYDLKENGIDIEQSSLTERKERNE
ncbi:MAG TPA: hypothetical protein VKV37_15285 [Ktedonobacteraceae bacterium]|jgi:hypothetical protein|nr:hypothetical protein [Ktedonobacteraceae bacterium]